MRRSDHLMWLLSAAIAFALLVIVHGERRVTVAYVLPVDTDVPDGVVASPSLPEDVTVVVSGPWARLRGLGAEKLGPVRVELSRASHGVVAWRARPEALHVPSGARVESITPAQGSVELRRDVR